MIEKARQKASHRDGTQPTFVVGDALDLPYPDASFDAVTSAFTIRNMADVPRAFAEAYRVLKPGGRVVCLQLSHAQSDLVRLGFDLYFNNMAPLLGAALERRQRCLHVLTALAQEFPLTPRPWRQSYATWGSTTYVSAG